MLTVHTLLQTYSGLDNSLLEVFWRCVQTADHMCEAVARSKLWCLPRRLRTQRTGKCLENGRGGFAFDSGCTWWTLDWLWLTLVDYGWLWLNMVKRLQLFVHPHHNPHDRALAMTVSQGCCIVDSPSSLFVCPTSQPKEVTLAGI